MDLVSPVIACFVAVYATERGRGVATAGLVAATTRLFEDLGLRRLQLFHAVENIGSSEFTQVQIELKNAGPAK